MIGLATMLMTGRKALTWSTTWSKSLTINGGTSGEYSYRQVIAAADISTSGSTIRVTFTANSSGTNFVIQAAAIGERSGSTANCVATPTQLLFGGNAGTTITAGQSRISDALVFSLDETKSYIVIIDFASGATAAKYASSGFIYYKALSDSYNQATVTGYSTAAQTNGVSKIEVGA